MLRVVLNHTMESYGIFCTRQHEGDGVTIPYYCKPDHYRVKLPTNDIVWWDKKECSIASFTKEEAYELVYADKKDLKLKTDYVRAKMCVTDPLCDYEFITQGSWSFNRSCQERKLKNHTTGKLWLTSSYDGGRSFSVVEEIAR